MVDVFRNPPLDSERGSNPPSDPPAGSELYTELYPAALYEAVHTGLPGDLDFYRAAAHGAHAILELGCGSGRVIEALEADGHTVVGLDLSPGLLARARERTERAELVLGDMRELEEVFGERRFDRIFCPFNGMYCMLDEEDLLRTLRGARALLSDDGLLVFDGYDASDFHEGGDAADDDNVDVPEWVKTVACEGDEWDVFESSRWDRDAQLIEATYHHVPREGAGPSVIATIPQRYLVESQIAPLLAEAGLELLVLHGDFDQSVWTDESPLLVVTARPALEA